MSTTSPPGARRTTRRGRPPKYGRPAKVVALTLPAEVVERLQRVHSDLGWAVVRLAEKSTRPDPGRPDTGDAQLVEVGAAQSLIVVNPARFHSLAGLDVVPLSATQAFLALQPGKGMADLELAVIDRVESLPAGDERRAWTRLRDRLRKWRHDRRLRFDNRSIIIVTRVGAREST